MAGLLYRPDMDAVRQRLTTWWDGGDLGRPALQLWATAPAPQEDIPALPEPAGWLTGYSTKDFAYRVNCAARCCVGALPLAEAVPATAPDLGPGCLALYLGSEGVEERGTVWFRSFIKDPEAAVLEYDPDNFYWDFTRRLGRECVRLGRGKFLVQFPDLIEGLDILAAIRGNQNLLIDLIERPEWVHRMLARITDLYFCYYDRLYEMFRDEVGGSLFWIWGPGRTAKLQTDFSAMISPAMFAEFQVPVLREMTERLSYCLYHWDGPGAIAHHDHLLSIPGIKVLQWTPGAGAVPTTDPRWWPLYHKTIEAGKGVYIGADDLDAMLRMKREFGRKFHRFLFGYWKRFESVKEAERLMAALSD